jgi:hypothetical protein
LLESSVPSFAMPHHLLSWWLMPDRTASLTCAGYPGNLKKSRAISSRVVSRRIGTLLRHYRPVGIVK